MACIDFLIWVGTPKKRSVTVKKVYKPARYSTINGYIEESEELGCCRRIPQLPSWAVPGESRVFLIHQGNHKRLDRGSIFGYYTLKRVEFIAKQTGPDPIKPRLGQLPWSNKYHQEFKKRVRSCWGAADEKACIKNKYPERLKLNFPRDVSKGKIKFRSRRPKKYKDPFEEIVEEAFEEFMEECWKELQGRLKSWDYEIGPQEQAEEDYALVPQELAGEEGGRACSKRGKAGAIYLVDALSSEITDAFHKKLYDWLEEHEDPKKYPGASRKKLLKELKETESKIIYPEEGIELFRKAKREVLERRKPKAGELVLFDEPYPIFQRFPRAAFRGYLRIDGDNLLKQMEEERKVTPSIPYCNGSDIEPNKPKTKAQLVTHFVAKLGLQRTVVNKFFRELSKLVPDELNRAKSITLPGLGRLVLSEGKARRGIKFRPAKGIKDEINPQKSS